VMRVLLCDSFVLLRAPLWLEFRALTGIRKAPPFLKFGVALFYFRPRVAD
jgi:hypothetical protein